MLTVFPSLPCPSFCFFSSIASSQQTRGCRREPALRPSPAVTAFVEPELRRLAESRLDPPRGCCFPPTCASPLEPFSDSARSIIHTTAGGSLWVAGTHVRVERKETRHMRDSLGKAHFARTCLQTRPVMVEYAIEVLQVAAASNAYIVASSEEKTLTITRGRRCLLQHHSRRPTPLHQEARTESRADIALALLACSEAAQRRVEEANRVITQDFRPLGVDAIATCSALAAARPI